MATKKAKAKIFKYTPGKHSNKKCNASFPLPRGRGKRKKQAKRRIYRQHKNKKGDRSLPKIK